MIKLTLKVSFKQEQFMTIAPTSYTSGSEPFVLSRTSKCETLDTTWQLKASETAWIAAGIFFAAVAAGATLITFVYTLPVSVPLTAAITLIGLSAIGSGCSFWQARQAHY